MNSTLPPPMAPSTLRDLGHALIERARAMESKMIGPPVPAAQLTDEGLNRLAEMVMLRQRPTVGFWLRYRVPAS